MGVVEAARHFLLGGFSLLSHTGIPTDDYATRIGDFKNDVPLNGNSLDPFYCMLDG